MTACGFLAVGLALGAMAQRPANWEDRQLRSAEDYIRQKDLRKAAQVLQTIIDVEPACHTEVYVKLARVRLELGDDQQGLRIAERGLEANPKAPELLKLLGQILFRKDPSERRSGDLFHDAVEVDPTDAEAHYLYGEWACTNNLEELCLEELNRAAALPTSGDQAKMQIYTFIAMAENRLNHTSRADAAFRKALEFNWSLRSPSPDSLFEYIKFLVTESRDAEAQALITKLLRLAPRYGPAYLERAKHLSQLGQLERAAKDAETALQYAGDDKPQQRAAHIFLAKTYHALGREQQAKAHVASLRPN